MRDRHPDAGNLEKRKARKEGGREGGRKGEREGWNIERERDGGRAGEAPNAANRVQRRCRRRLRHSLGIIKPLLPPTMPCRWPALPRTLAALHSGRRSNWVGMRWPDAIDGHHQDHRPLLVGDPKRLIANSYNSWKLPCTPEILS